MIDHSQVWIQFRKQTVVKLSDRVALSWPLDVSEHTKICNQVWSATEVLIGRNLMLPVHTGINLEDQV
jgi:hypothetical protein